MDLVPPFPYIWDMPPGAVLPCDSQWDYLRSTPPQPFELYSRQNTPREFTHSPVRMPKCVVDSRALFIAFPPGEFSKCERLSDFFNEEARMKAHRKGHDSPYVFWFNHYTKVLNCALCSTAPWVVAARAFRPEVNAFTMREALATLVPECTLFKPMLAKAIYLRFGASSVVDISAGWGDRILGALAAGVQQYIGYDPNPDLRDGHARMIQQFAAAGQNFLVHCLPFELPSTPLPPDGSVDMVFSSPPYFDLESYHAGAAQSIVAHPDWASWLHNFLFASMRRAWQVLRTNGFLVLHFNNSGKRKTLEPLLLYILASLPGSRLIERLYAIGSKPRPIWVFKKCETDDEIGAAKANALLQLFFERNQ